MSTKKIGIVGWKTGENSFGATAPYMEFLSKLGDVIVLPPTETVFELDLLVLPGGKDTLSYNYGQVPSFYNTDPDLMKEFFLLNNLKKYVENRTPIFGICLGFQMLNVHFGGKLVQNCWHEQSEKSRSELVHEIKFTPEYYQLRNALFEKKTKKEYKVNSMHHQGVLVGELAEPLKCIAYHEEIVEVMEHTELPIAGVQYHPEEIYDSLSSFLIQNLLELKEVTK
jgi:putative glutamine amidotransferase